MERSQDAVKVESLVFQGGEIHLLDIGLCEAQRFDFRACGRLDQARSAEVFVDLARFFGVDFDCVNAGGGGDFGG